MKLFIYVILTIFIIIKAGIFHSKTITFDNNVKKKSIIQNTISINEKGEYEIKGEFNNYTFSVNSSYVSLNFINAKINNSFNPIILIQNNLHNITINLNNTKMYSINTSIFKIKRFDYVKFNAYSSFLKGDVIFDSDDKYKLNINGNISVNEEVKQIDKTILNKTDNKRLNKINNVSLNKTQLKILNKTKKEILNKKENRSLNNTKKETLNKKEDIKQSKQIEKNHKKDKKRNKNRNKKKKKKNQKIQLNNSKNIINQNRNEQKIEKKNSTLRKLLIKKNPILEKIKIIKGNISINWDFSIFCNEQLNIINLTIYFSPKKLKSKNYFSKFLKLKKSNTNNKLSSNLFEKELNCKIKLKERIIVTMTSWKKRILTCKKTIELLLTNSLPPYKLILNLAEEEFPNKNLDLPKSLLSLLKKYPNFEIYWVKKNNNVFKKLIPTINRYKKDLIITVDDDVIYPNDMIEKVIFQFKKYGSNNPMSFGGKNTDWKFIKKKKNSFKRIRIGSHYGACSIVKYEFFNEKINELYYQTTESQIKKGIKCFDDFLYTYAALLNGYFYIRNREYSVRYYVDKSPNLKNSFSKFENKKTKIKKWNQYRNIIKSYIRRVYKISVHQLIIDLRKKKKKLR